MLGIEPEAGYILVNTIGKVLVFVACTDCKFFDKRHL